MKCLCAIFTLVLLLSLLTGCDTPDDDVIFGGFCMNDELIGIWLHYYTHWGIVLIFNDDGTGMEYRLYNGSSYKSLVWTRENGYLIIEGIFDDSSRKFSYSISESVLTLLGIESGNYSYFYCVYSHGCCCVRGARNYFFDVQ